MKVIAEDECQRALISGERLGRENMRTGIARIWESDIESCTTAVQALLALDMTSFNMRYILDSLHLMYYYELHRF